MSRATDVVAYTYDADTYCPDCTLALVKARHPLDYPLSSTVQASDTAEDILRTVAKSLRLGNEDESSYDSDDFPKVVFSSQIDEPEHCGRCGEEIDA